MMNLSGFSFLSHAAINTFCHIKKKFPGKPKGSASRPRARDNGFVSGAIIAIIFSVNFYALGAVIADNLQHHSNIDLIRQAIIQVTPVASAKPKSAFSAAPAAPAEVTALSPVPAAPVPKNQARPSTYLTVVNEQATDSVRAMTETARPGENLRDVIERILLRNMGNDPCARQTNGRASSCRDALRQNMGEEIDVYLKQNGFPTPEKGGSAVAIESGSQVTLDGRGAITITRPANPAQK